MKSVINLFFFLLIFILSRTAAFASDYLLTKDSIQYYPNAIYKNWKFNSGDDSSMSFVEYDDSKWTDLNPALRISDTVKTQFAGRGWFRLHIIADSTVVGIPLAMMISHYGASEVYLDGKLLKKYGIINSADSSVYFDPREVPFIFILKNTGKHILSVRYANYDAEKNYKSYGQPKAGFELMIGEADHYIEVKNERSIILSFLLMMLGGIFLAIAVIHIFLFFYNRADKSNLYFSIFMFCIASLFVIGFIGYSTNNPLFAMRSFFIVQPTIALACITLSGFIRELFSKTKWRFVLFTIAGIIAFILHIFGLTLGAILTSGLLISVSFEAVFTIIFAIIKKVQGARIIGTGILLFTLFILTIFALALGSGGNFDINDSTTTGKILELFLALSILSIPVSMSLYQAWRFARINKDLGLQLVQVKVLSQKSLEQEQEKKKILESQKEKLEEEVAIRTAELRKEKKKSDDLLLNILPAEVADELKEKGSADAKQFEQVTVLFTDFKNFTRVSETLSAQDLVNEINFCYSEFDRIISGYGIEKIKTIGDAYMCAGGLPVENKNNAEATVNAALDILDFMLKEKAKRNEEGKSFFEIRIGVHTGPVVAGIVGIKKFAYDIWGDTVNIASRMETAGETGKVNISGSTYEVVKNKFSCTYRGKIEAKNKGEIDMYFVNRSTSAG